MPVNQKGQDDEKRTEDCRHDGHLKQSSGDVAKKIQRKLPVVMQEVYFSHGQ